MLIGDHPYKGSRRLVRSTALRAQSSGRARHLHVRFLPYAPGAFGALGAFGAPGTPGAFGAAGAPGAAGMPGAGAALAPQLGHSSALGSTSAPH